MEPKYQYAPSDKILIITATEQVKKTKYRKAGLKFCVTCKEITTGKEILRIDCSKHKGNETTHIHFTHKKNRRNKDPVKYDENIQTPFQAEEYILKYLKKNFPELL